jgi:hypothetical protein
MNDIKLTYTPDLSIDLSIARLREIKNYLDDSDNNDERKLDDCVDITNLSTTLDPKHSKQEIKKMTMYYLVDIGLQEPEHAVVVTAEYRDLNYVGACSGCIAKMDIDTSGLFCDTLDECDRYYHARALQLFKEWATKKGLKLKLVS